jgi:hypothetical protein
MFVETLIESNKSLLDKEMIDIGVKELINRIVYSLTAKGNICIRRHNVSIQENGYADKKMYCNTCDKTYDLNKNINNKISIYDENTNSIYHYTFNN